MTLIQESLTPFFQYDFNDGFMISGDLLLFSGGGIKHDLSDPYPTFMFSIRNLGEKKIIAIRARINELDLPYTFGVSNDNPISHSRSESFSRYTAWYTPGGADGYLPVDGEEYTVTVTFKFSDYSTQTFTRSGVFTEGTIGSIRSGVGRGYLFFNEPDLLSLGLGKGGSLSLSFRKQWYTGSSQTVDHLELYLKDTLVWEEDIRVRPAGYFDVTVPVPFEIVPEQHYNVTMVAH